MVMSGQMLIEWLGRKLDSEPARRAAALIEKAVGTVMREKRSLTADLGGTSKTSEMGDAIVHAIRHG